MKVASITTWIMSVIFIAAVALLVYFLRLVIKALKTYIRSKEVREEKAKVAKSLGEVLKQHRTECKMTQEFVAEALGVSRQAVSKQISAHGSLDCILRIHRFSSNKYESNNEKGPHRTHIGDLLG